MTDLINLIEGPATEGPTTEEPVTERAATDGSTDDGGNLELRWEDSADAAAWPRRPGRTRRSRILRSATAAVVIALVALLAFAGLQIRHNDQLAAARTSALAAGTKDAELMATYSYKDFSAYARQIEAMSTTQFATNFKKDSSALSQVLTQYKAGSQGSSSGAGVSAVSTSKASVYVFLDETVSNSQEKATTERARMLVTLVRRGGKWLISNAVVE